MGCNHFSGDGAKMNNLKTSVVMTTFNGEFYLREQLDSLRTQTKKIDEVLIFDDGSTDNTESLIRKYIEDFNLAGWQYLKNHENKGWKRNFFEGINQATGDVIFPCDQDDIWLEDKIEYMSDCFLKDGNIDVLVGRYDKFFMEENKNEGVGKKVALFVDKLGDVVYRKKRNDGRFCREKFQKSFLHVEPGCCMAIRKDFVQSIREYWIPELGHDSFYTFFSKIKGTYYLLNKTVIKWRQHFGSASRPTTRKKMTRLNEIECNENLFQKLNLYINKKGIYDKNKEKIILKAQKWNKLRKSFLKSPSISKGLKLIWYFDFYERRRAFITDWIYAYMKE